MIDLAVLFAVPLIITLVSTRYVIDFLKKRKLVAPDAHKPDKPLVPRIGGIAIFTGVTSGILVAMLLFHAKLIDWQTLLRILVFYSVFSLTALIGLIDDLKVLRAKVKTGLTILGVVPLLVAAYLNIITIGRPELPIIGRLRMTLIYWFLLPLAVAAPANAVNMLEIMNGIMPATCSIALTATLVSALILGGRVEAVYISLILLGTLVAYYHYNKYPARIFSGDMGSLSVGAALGALAVIGRLEFIVMVTLFPHIMNAFYVISSVRGLKERREILRPTVVKENGLIEASLNPQAPLTLARLILAKGPLTEKQIVDAVILLEIAASTLAVCSAILMKIY